MEFHQFAVKKFYGRVLFDIFCIECCFTPGVEPAVLPAADSDAEDVDIQEFGLFKCGQAHARCIQTEDSANTMESRSPSLEQVNNSFQVNLSSNFCPAGFPRDWAVAG